MKKIFLFFVLVVSTITLQAQRKKLSFSKLLMGGGKGLFKPLPKILNWQNATHYLEFKSVDGKNVIEQVSVKGKRKVYFDYSKWDKQLPEGFSLERAIAHSSDYKKFLFKKNNDLYYFSVVEKVFKKLTNDSAQEINPEFSPDGKLVAYTKGRNLYIYDIEKEREKQLTFDGGGLIYNGYSSWVYGEEIIGRSAREKAYWWSPKSDKIAFLRTDDSPVPEYPIFHTKGIHGFLEKTRYPQAGDPDPIVKFGVADIKTGKITWAKFNYKKDQYIAWPFWQPEGKYVTVQWMNREQDSIKIYKMNISNGNLTELYTETQKTWVEWFKDFHILRKNKGMIFRSNKTGWTHLYLIDANGKHLKQLTKGNWEVKKIDYIDEKLGYIYFEGWIKESTENHLMKINFKGGGLRQITRLSGTHSCKVAPGGRYFLDTFSNIKTPTQILLKNSNGKLIKKIGESKGPDFNDYELAKVELFRIKTDDNWNLPAIWYLPPEFNKNKKYPVIISIYGGPNAGTVHNNFSRWSIFNYYLAQNGIIVMSVDHRASGHFGKMGVNYMYRHLGKWEMHDYIEAVKWLQRKSFVDTNKIAITGGSYGGYVTCMALTYGARYFDYGIAQYSVTDWHLYDNVYTERYMDKPDENPEGYRESSVLTYANRYKGGLLITHGFIDDNVHIQNTMQFVNKLENLNKDFELMIYPGERHGIRHKFLHSLQLIMKFWFKHLLNKNFIPD